VSADFSKEDYTQKRKKNKASKKKMKDNSRPKGGKRRIFTVLGKGLFKK